MNKERILGKIDGAIKLEEYVLKHGNSKISWQTSLVIIMASIILNKDVTGVVLKQNISKAEAGCKLELYKILREVINKTSEDEEKDVLSRAYQLITNIFQGESNLWQAALKEIAVGEEQKTIVEDIHTRVFGIENTIIKEYDLIPIKNNIQKLTKIAIYKELLLDPEIKPQYLEWLSAKEDFLTHLYPYECCALLKDLTFTTKEYTLFYAKLIALDPMKLDSIKSVIETCLEKPEFYIVDKPRASGNITEASSLSSDDELHKQKKVISSLLGEQEDAL